MTTQERRTTSVGARRVVAPSAASVPRPAPSLQPQNRNPVVVGIDGSGCARNAAQWAGEEAAHRQAELRLVYAYHLPPARSWGGNLYPPQLLADLREVGHAVLDDTAAVVHRLHPDLKISRSLAYGDPATVLRHASGRAALTVVGAHGPSRMAVALGSVAASVAVSASSPVAVIHPGAVNRKGPVVVGVDGSPISKAALSYAFRAAADRHATLLAVHCWTDPSIDGPVPAYSAGIVDPAAIRTEEQRRLAGELADLVIEYPGVRVEQAVIHERPAAGLLRLSGGAQLVVAGSRGHRRIAGLLLGSTGQALIAHCTCPVVIARTALPS